MTTQDIAKMLVKRFDLPAAEKYNAVLREWDNQIEVIGLIPDPNFELSGLEGSNYFPKCWVTLGVIPASTEV